MTVTSVPAQASGFGYEGLTQVDLIRDLTASGITVLVDVRLTPISRKRGLSKTALAVALADAGIRYEHLRGLGNPKWNRAGFAVSDPVSRSIYAELLSHGDGQRDLVRLQGLCRAETVGLLCFEESESHCHRSIILDSLRAAQAVT
jgi:uncharacterized protein (DUF488 family)